MLINKELENLGEILVDLPAALKLATPEDLETFGHIVHAYKNHGGPWQGPNGVESYLEEILLAVLIEQGDPEELGARRPQIASQVLDFIRERELPEVEFLWGILRETYYREGDKDRPIWEAAEIALQERQKALRKTEPKPELVKAKATPKRKARRKAA